MNNSEPLRLKITGKSYLKEREVLFGYVDSKLEKGSFKTKWSDLTLPIIHPRKKEVPIKIEPQSDTGYIEDRCDVSKLTTNSSDERCLSIAVSSVRKKEEHNLLRLIDKNKDLGWYPLETDRNKYFRWIKQKANLEIFNGEPREVKLLLSLRSYLTKRKISIYNKGDLKRTELVKPTEFKKITVKLQPGLNRLRFETDSCRKPYLESNSPDKRCLSLAFDYIGFKNN